MGSRREFLKKVTQGAGGVFAGVALLEIRACQSAAEVERTGKIMSVQGLLEPREFGMALPHEHVLVDFIGANKVSRDRYDRQEVIRKVVPYLERVRRLGCDTLVECTPAYIGRDPMLLRRLSTITELQILTNTGYYGAADDKFVPAHAFDESPDQLADRWIREGEDGIEGSDIYPGFIKTGVDSGPLSSIDEKLVTAAARTHLATGLTIACHTGGDSAIVGEMEVLEREDVDGRALIWVHAQNEEDPALHVRAAKAGIWVEFDGIHPDRIEAYVKRVQAMKEAGYIHKVLLSQDAGWYHVGEPDGGTYRPHDTIFTDFIPALKSAGISSADIQQMTVENPRQAFTIRIRRA
ncbi:MAG TPA: phosphotriesterase [bacterium]|nr:phosphotriesterase [bacterium]